ncbi:uncharacterized protein LOC130053885 [Ostrea edulis]|uniref:uncharacterized protein LOC130053885 n=1 Tax=Ostrea edulis TaxID=37623 RepID=UPI0024AF9A08|nr:uncharacterized protein LOC130053885 [Ostrea edulis]
MADINQVSAKEICTTCAISDELAEEIVRTRREYGPFRYLRDLWRVEGMSNTAAGVLSSMYHINIDTSTQHSPTKNIYPRVSGTVSPRTRRKISQSRDERLQSRSTSHKGSDVERVESDEEKEMAYIVVKNVNGQEHNTLAKTAHVQKSPSGNKLYIKCEGIRGYRINGASRTSSETRAESNACTEQSNHLGNSKLYKTFYSPINSRRNRLRGEFSKTKFEFWNRIEEGWKDLELCEKRVPSAREKRTAKWIRSLPNKVEIDIQNSEPQAVQKVFVTSKQNFSQERLNIGHSRGQKYEKGKRPKGRKTADPGEVNAQNSFDSLETVAGTSEQTPSKRRKTRPSRDRNKKTGKIIDKKKTRRDHKKPSRDRRKKSDRKDEKKKKSRGHKTKTPDESFCIIL